MNPRFIRARCERGVAAVEAGLVTTVLMPLLVGVLVWGNYFWHAQKVEPYAARLPQAVGMPAATTEPKKEGNGRR